MQDKVWADIITKLNAMLIHHVKRRTNVMVLVWMVIALFFVTFSMIAFGAGQLHMLWFQITAPVMAAFIALIVPNLCFTYFTIRPLLRAFEDWKRFVTFQFDKRGIEIIKVTTGEVKSRYREMMCGIIVVGSIQ
jgi:hypothetical protein